MHEYVKVRLYLNDCSPSGEGALTVLLGREFQHSPNDHAEPDIYFQVSIMCKLKENLNVVVFP